MYWTIEKIQQLNADAGQHFFAPDTMRFFDSRVLSKVFPSLDNDAAYFVTSERHDSSSPRRYTVRRVDEEGLVETVGNFQAYETVTQAYKAAWLRSLDIDAWYVSNPRWIVYLSTELAHAGSELRAADSVEDAVELVRQHERNVGMNAYGTLYTWTEDDWRGAKNFEDIGIPFDYPDKLIERGPKGGFRAVNA